MTKAQLIAKLEAFDDDTKIVVRTIEADEKVCLTVDLTGVISYQDGSVLLVGDLDRAFNPFS